VWEARSSNLLRLLCCVRHGWHRLASVVALRPCVRRESISSLKTQILTTVPCRCESSSSAADNQPDVGHGPIVAASDVIPSIPLALPHRNPSVSSSPLSAWWCPPPPTGRRPPVRRPPSAVLPLVADIRLRPRAGPWSAVETFRPLSFFCRPHGTLWWSVVYCVAPSRPTSSPSSSTRDACQQPVAVQPPPLQIHTPPLASDDPHADLSCTRCPEISSACCPFRWPDLDDDF
jgi:hypothetical protein